MTNPLYTLTENEILFIDSHLNVGLHFKKFYRNFNKEFKTKFSSSELATAYIQSMRSNTLHVPPYNPTPAPRNLDESVQLTPELQRVYNHMTQQEYGEILPLDESTPQEADMKESADSDSRTQQLIDRILSALTE